MRLFIFLLCTLLIGYTPLLVAQDAVPKDAQTLSQTDSLHKKLRFQPDAKRAGLYAALMPGLGQIYNRQYWKVPIVYALMGTTTYMVIKNNNDYQKYRKVYVARLANPNSTDEFTGILSTTAVKQYQDDAKRKMDMMLIYTVVAYAGQLMEAIAGAHLHNFDISKDLSMQIRPVLTPVQTLGVGLVLNFKR